ncbi:sulfurtransferase [Hydrogenophaga sp.]|uniref:sulfurtransferase n=1 Tax=Hydrogenophaga sp. TaxID=1904254 RepID=UPI00356536B7
MHKTLISAAQLRQHLDQHAAVRVFDCSFDLGQPSAGLAQYLEQHIPGAVHADLNTHLSALPGDASASGGRHPLPSREAFAAWLADTGLQAGQQVVVYDRQGSSFCGRLWWMLKWCGHEAVAVLDGGWAAWRAAGGASEIGPATAIVPKGSFQLQAALVDVASAQEMAGALGSTRQTVVDARAGARFRGETEPLDPVAGHIPGALNRPFADNFTPDGHFKPAAQLRAEWSAVLGGRDPASVIHQCGSGVTATPNLLAMEIAGLGRSRLFPGSWSEWCNTPGLPVAQG